LLRGYIDAGDKAVNFPSCLKRLCVVYVEELDDALEESAAIRNSALPEQHRFQITVAAHWKDHPFQGQERGQGHPGRPTRH
jgi:hypothetical protein